MKKSYAIFLFIFMSSVVYGKGTLTLREKLKDLNACWKTASMDLIPSKATIPEGEIPLIQMHLSLVENALRSKTTNHLTNHQRSNRMKCLNILHAYGQEGIFPKNLYHEKRTPYFIDKFGTACAVGQLIIKTGNEDLAKKISKENNYDYISELNIKYPAIAKWADENGFTIDELAWIQPAYANCDTACILIANISATGGQPPYSYLWSNGQTTSYAINLCPGSTYSCIVTDGSGNTIVPDSCQISCNTMIFPGTNVINLPPAFPLYLSVSSTLDNGGCDGTATAHISEGAAPYYFYWYPGGQTTQTATGLCQGIYYVSVTDANNCYRTDSVVINTSVGFKDLHASALTIYPNPAANKFVIHSEKVFSEKAQLIITNSLHQVVLTKRLTSNLAEVDISGLEKGSYILSFVDDKSVERRRIIKN